jgi:RNA polymerase sigma-70 factor (ECF subfamily)
VGDARRERFEVEAVVHLPDVYRAAYRLTRREDEARDVTQETMLRAYRTYDGFQSGTNARAWLLTIAYSVFVNRYHQQRRQPSQLSIEDLEARHADALAAPVTPALAPGVVWTDGEVEDALADLPEAFRAAVLLVDVEELTYEEAAAALGCAVGTIRSRLFRARRLLAAALADFARDRGFGRRGTESS